MFCIDYTKNFSVFCEPPEFFACGSVFYKGGGIIYKGGDFYIFSGGFFFWVFF